MEEHSTAVLKGFSVSALELDEEVAAEIVTHYKSISAGPMASGTLLVSRSRTLLDIWRIGPRKTGMPCSASSTAISARKKVQHGASPPRSARS
jgi:hypothetical protein